MKHTCKRMTALVLALAMCFSLLAPAWAADVEAEEEVTAEIVAGAVEETGETTKEEETEEQPQEEAEVAEPDEAETEVEEAEKEPAAEEDEEAEPAEDEGDATVSAQDYTSGYWTYTVSNGYATVTGYTGSSKSITIPSTLGGYTVTGIGRYAFEDSTMTSLTIPTSITSIGYRAFYNCTKLSSITINAKTLNDCDDGGGTFYNAGASSNGVKVTFGSSVKKIPACLFYVNASEDSGTYAHITSVTMSSSIESIGRSAFDNCYSLTSMSWGSGITSIDRYAFQNTAITSVTIPSGTTSIGYRAFYNCTKLSSITINAKTLDDCDNGGGTFYNAGADKNSLTVTFGSTVKKIPAYLFYVNADYNYGEGYYAHITSVTIPSSVESIGKKAFQNCYDLKTVTVNGKSTTFADSSFDGCLSSLTFKCYSGSTAATYATSNGFKVSYLSVTLSTPTLSSVSNTTSGVKVSWKAVSGAAKYRVFRKTGSGSWTKVGDTTSTSYTDTTAKSGTTYKYTVRCINSAGTSYTSSYNSTGLSIKYLTAGKISSLTNTSKGITVKWGKVTGASGYYVYRKTSGGSYSRIATVKNGSTVSYSDTAVKSKNGTTYVYAVRPYSGSYTGSYTGKTTVRLTGVSISSLKNVKTKKMTVKWGKNSKATGYQIQYSTSSSFSSYKTVTVTSASTVSKTISSLTKGKKYYVRVRAYKTVSGTKYYSAWSSTKNVKISK